MNVVWIILVVVAVIVVIAVVAMMRRGRSAAGETAAPEPGRLAEPAPPREPKAKKSTAHVARAAPKPRRDAGASVREPEVKAEPESIPEVSPPAATRPSVAPPTEEVEERPAAKPEPAEPAQPRISEEELRSRLQLQLADSERMLGELKEATTTSEEGADPNPLAGSVQIIEEGLKEVRSLAERDQWGQAKDKGEALHAQLALMLQMARREGSS